MNGTYKFKCNWLTSVRIRMHNSRVLIKEIGTLLRHFNIIKFNKWDFLNMVTNRWLDEPLLVSQQELCSTEEIIEVNRHFYVAILIRFSGTVWCWIYGKWKKNCVRISFQVSGFCYFNFIHYLYLRKCIYIGRRNMSDAVLGLCLHPFVT